MQNDDMIRETGEFHFGKNVGYVQLPADYSPKRKYPCLLFFSGRGGNHMDSNFSAPDFEEFRKEASRRGYVVAIPDYGTDSWMNDTASKIIDEMVEHLKANVSIEPEVCVIGCSMGGLSALIYTARHYHEVCAVVDVFGITDMERFYTESGYKDSIGTAFDGSPTQNPQAYTKSSAINYTDELSSLPVFVIHGTLDIVVPLAYSERLCRELENKCGNLKFRIVDGVGHENRIVCGLESEIFDFFDHARKTIPCAKN